MLCALSSRPNNHLHNTRWRLSTRPLVTFLVGIHLRISGCTGGKQTRHSAACLVLLNGLRHRIAAPTFSMITLEKFWQVMKYSNIDPRTTRCLLPKPPRLLAKQLPIMVSLIRTGALAEADQNFHRNGKQDTLLPRPDVLVSPLAVCMPY